MNDSESRPSSAPIIAFISVAVVLMLIAGGAIYAFIHQQGERRRAFNERVVEDMMRAMEAREAESNRLRDEIMKLRSDLEEANRKLAAAPPPPPPPSASPSPSPSPAPNLEKDFEDLAEDGISAYGREKFQALARKLKDAGKEGLDVVVKRLLTSDSPIDRFLAGALIEAIGDAAAIPALAESAKKEKDDLTRRMVVHALAIIRTDAAEAPLREAMTSDADWGVRTNASYGLAKMGRDDGVANLVKYYESSDTPAEYRMAVLAGLADVAAPSTAPMFRRLLAESKEMGAQLAAIGALAKMKDSGAVNDLKRLAETSTIASVRQAAERAIATITK